ncbi:MAG: hypothetical protein M1415_05585 [Firmicutes bacterium]|jgi:hypothetical protein|nr:hypothetical protein [Bacillota bacterium]MCL5063532.1 hypothetical protein [Bacillota bacterium]
MVVPVYPVQNTLIIQFDDAKIVQRDVQPWRASGGIFAKLRDDRVVVDELTVLNGTVAWRHDFDPEHGLDLDPLRRFLEDPEITNLTR